MFYPKWWLLYVSRQFKWSSLSTNLAEFAESIEAFSAAGKKPVLCLDEFEELASRRNEFTHDFFLTLRACSQQGMSIITSSQQPLSELTEQGDPTSPFYNIFPLLRLQAFSDTETQSFVDFHWQGTPHFIQAEKDAIIEFSKGHPLALQIACFHVLEAKWSGESLISAMRKAADDMNAHIPAGW